jgi:hypothetical protein
MQRFGNTFVRALLRSPLHRLLSGSLLLVTYTGRQSGRTFTIPVMYVQDEVELVVYVGRSSDKVWWRNLRGGAQVSVRLRGRELTGTGSAVPGSAELQKRYLSRFPRASQSLTADPAPIFVRMTGLRPR